MIFRNFPLDFVPTQSWRQPAGNLHGPGRHFGAGRPGPRWHAGCDLIAPEGSNVYGIDNGIVLYAGQLPISYLPAAHVYEVQIEHRAFVVRYMELGHIAHGLARGSRVQARDVIGTVGRMVNDSMLHFELYGGTVGGNVYQAQNSTGYYYVDSGPYWRRRDLVDPTDELLELSGNLP